MVRDFDFIVIVSSHHLTVASCLSLDVGYDFLGGFQHSSLDGCVTTCCNLFLQLPNLILSKLVILTKTTFSSMDR